MAVRAPTEGTIYRLILRPWLWLLSKRSNCLIFREKTAPQIIKAIFDAHGGLANFKDSCSKTYPTLEYCAQYRESDMDFVCRLMEQHGISYHFRHEKGAHKLVMGDDSLGLSAGRRRDAAVQSPWSTITGATASTFPRGSPSAGSPPARSRSTTTTSRSPHPSSRPRRAATPGTPIAQLEDYDYPGKYVKQSEGMDYAQARLDMVRAEDSHFTADGDCVSLAPGNLMSLTDHPDGAQNEQYLVLRCSHVFTGQSYRSGTRRHAALCRRLRVHARRQALRAGRS